MGGDTNPQWWTEIDDMMGEVFSDTPLSTDSEMDFDSSSECGVMKDSDSD
jgi:hypothetical protein